MGVLESALLYIKRDNTDDCATVCMKSVTEEIVRAQQSMRSQGVVCSLKNECGVCIHV